jgi:hypothetical protein
MDRMMQITTTKARQSLLSFIAVIFLTPTLGATNAVAHPGTPIEQGFNDMYNLDFSSADRQFDVWEAAYPDDPMGPVCHAAALLFAEFNRLGVLESQLFIDNNRFDDRRKLSPDPQTKRQFMADLDSADALADKALRRNSQDANAEFTKILAFGLRSDYAALIEKRDLAALRYTRQGRQFAEVLLKQKPDDSDAYLAVGVENYLSGIKPAPIRWLLSAGGVETDKAQGIHDLELTAAHGDLLAPFAQLLLAVSALRDKDQPQACSLLTSLSQRYTRNPLYRNELVQNHCDVNWRGANLR